MYKLLSGGRLEAGLLYTQAYLPAACPRPIPPPNTYYLFPTLITSTKAETIYRSLSPSAGRLEGGLLYTQSYLRSIKAQLRGALRATVSPALLAGLIREAGLEAGAGGAGGGGGLAGLGGGGVITTLVEELVAEGGRKLGWGVGWLGWGLLYLAGSVQ